jgi:2'-5' RNA ligase
MGPTQRVFVALWPQEGVRTRLAEIARALAHEAPNGRLVPAENLHLTLAFIGSLEEPRIDVLRKRLEGWRVQPFVWRLDHLGAFPRARVVWVGGEPSQALDDLVRNVRALLDELRIAYDPKSFAAHVTLVRDASRLIDGWRAIEPPIEWRSERAVLVRSTTGAAGARYLPLTPT